MTRKNGAVKAPETLAINTPESEAANGEAGNSASLSTALSGDERRASAVSANVHPDWAGTNEDEMRTRFPLTVAMMEGHSKETPPVLRVTSKRAGFWRGGISHPAAATDHPALSLSPAQAEAILGEPMLVVEII